VPQGTTRARFEALYQRYTANSGREGAASVELAIDDRDGFMEVREAPTGFMCIKRQVFDRLIAAYPELRYVPDWPRAPTLKAACITASRRDGRPESNRYLSEDYGFCRIFEKIGGKVYVDANSNLSYQGERLYTGDFASTLRTAHRSHGNVATALINHITLIELKPEVLERALEPFPLPLRTLDALHLASIEFLRGREQSVELASYDSRLTTAAPGSRHPTVTL
jgi:hypothetical protein